MMLFIEVYILIWIIHFFIIIGDIVKIAANDVPPVLNRLGVKTRTTVLFLMISFAGLVYSSVWPYHLMNWASHKLKLMWLDIQMIYWKTHKRLILIKVRIILIKVRIQTYFEDFLEYVRKRLNERYKE